MPAFRAPLDDYRFLLHELLELEKQRDLPEFAELSADLLDDILVGAARFCEEMLQPLNQSGDEEGCHLVNGAVRTPKGFKDAYRAYCEAGWGGLSAPVEYGGSGLPVLVTMAVAEMANAANQSFAMYPSLTGAATAALIATGAPWMKEHVVPKLVSGEWAGTMCLTESVCGTDLRLMQTRAVEQPDGTYRMYGAKIFISGGDQDLTANIIHMVIAKIPDGNGRLRDDLATVNFFMVPKFLVGEDGRLGGRNGVVTGSLEHKMGIKAQATCTLHFDGAVAWRLGPKPEAGEKTSSSAGMAGMFAMMNTTRLGVGVQGIAIGETAYQNALAYAHERRAGYALTGAKEPDKSADLLIVHPDVKRMLLHCRSFVEGARATVMWTTLNLAIARSGRPEAEAAGLVADLMTPVIKAFFTDMGFEAANLALQCYGGHGYIRDNGIEQLVRDGRVNQLYEGANGVQAMDLVGRKLGRKAGTAPLALFGMIADWLAQNASEAMAPFAKPLQRGLDAWQQATLWLARHGPANPDDAGAAASDYLRLTGIVVVGWMWARMANTAAEKLAADPPNAAFYRGKLTAAKYWMERMIPECPMLLERITVGGATIMELE